MRRVNYGWIFFVWDQQLGGYVATLRYAGGFRVAINGWNNYRRELFCRSTGDW